MFKYNTSVIVPLSMRFEFRKLVSKKHSARSGLKPQDQPGTMYLAVTIGKRRYSHFSSQIKTTRVIWDSLNNGLSTPEAKQLMRDLAAYEELVEQVYLQLTKEQESVTGSMLSAAVDRHINGVDNELTLARVYTEFLRAKYWQIERTTKARSEDTISQATYYTYQKRWALIHGYLQATKQLDILIVNVSYPAAVNMKEWFCRQVTPYGKPYESATINKLISMLKQLMVYALSKGYIKHNPLTDFSCRGGAPANPKPLTEAQIDHLENCELPLRLRQFCDAWLVAAELCLHYADFMELKGCSFVEHKGRRFLQRKRRKQAGSTLTQTVDVTPRAERILARNGGAQNLAYTSSAYFSKVLKQIAAKADLRDEFCNLVDLQFGMGRDTGLTLRAIDGANSIQLCKIAGWSKPVYAERYIGGSGAIDIVAAFADEQDKKRALKQTPGTPPDEPTNASSILTEAPQITPVAGTPFCRVA